MPASVAPVSRLFSRWGLDVFPSLSLAHGLFDRREPYEKLAVAARVGVGLRR